MIWNLFGKIVIRQILNHKYIMNEQSNSSLQVAAFAAGCFWGVEESFRMIKGVKTTIVGYTGGWFPNPSYDIVCTDKTGHAEAIQIQYDPNQVSYDQLLKV